MILKLGNEKVLRVLFLYLSCFARVRIFDVSWVTLNLITPITYRVHLTHIFLAVWPSKFSPNFWKIQVWTPASLCLFC